MITNNARCIREIKSKGAMVKAVFNKKKTLFTSKLNFNLRKKVLKCYTWRTALCDAEKWTLRKVEQKYLENLECGAGEEWRISAGPIV
jgi:hypothetical protein